MMFFNFFISKLESGDLSEIVLQESFPDSDNFDYLVQKNMYKKTPRDKITLEGLQERSTTEGG